MRFLKNLLINIGILLAIGVVLYLVAPDVMRQVFQLFKGIYGPAIIILLVVVAALPRRRRR